MMVEFSELQQAHDRKQHRGVNIGMDDDIVVNRSQYKDGREFGSVRACDWEMSLRQMDWEHLSIEMDASDGDHYEITITMPFQSAWRKLEAKAWVGEFELRCLMDSIENRGAAALQGGGNG